MGLLLFIALATSQADAKDVRVGVTSAVVSPAKPGGFKWDGSGSVNDTSLQEASRAVEAALASSNPAGAIAAAVVIPALAVVDRPDVMLRVVLIQDGKETAIVCGQVDNTSSPDWGVSGCVMHFDSDRKVMVQIQLTDVDAINDDPIGTVQLSDADLKDAIKAKKIHFVDTRDQSSTVWAIALSVIRE